MGEWRQDCPGSVSKTGTEEDVAEQPDDAGHLVAQPAGALTIETAAELASRLLRVGDARAILHRIAHGDPLKLHEQCAARIRERRLLVELERLIELALAVVATAAAVEQGGTVGTPTWLTAQIDRALDSILAEDQERERQAAEPCSPDDPDFAFVRDVFRIDPPMARSAAVAFNGLPLHIRSVFFALIMDAKTVEQCVAQGLGDIGSLKTAVRTAFFALGHLEDPRQVPTKE